MGAIVNEAVVSLVTNYVDGSNLFDLMFGNTEQVNLNVRNYIVMKDLLVMRTIIIICS